MCFGDMTETRRETSTQTQHLPEYLRSAAERNVARADSFASRPFESYTAPRVADLSGAESDAFGLYRTIAGSPNPYLTQIEGLYDRFSSAPAQSIDAAPSILGAGTDVRSTGVQDYMTPYLQQILAPMLQDIERQGVAQRKALDAQATMDGAYGDARSGIERAEQRRNQDVLRTNTIGTQSAQAFDRATGLRQADIANLLDVDKTNASYAEKALERAITGGKALEALDASQVQRGLTTADALAKAGATERGIEQGKLDANFEEFLRRQGFDADTLKLVTSVLAGTPYPKTTTGEASRFEPDNSGFQALGSLAGMVLPAILSDRRVKHDIAPIGQMFDGLTIYRFKYVGDDTVHIGLMAQDVEKVYPNAVKEIAGVKAVDYGAATHEAALMGEV